MTASSAIRRGAFTLIELLIVIAVVGILLGVLLPALGLARTSARSVECASGIRQLALANDLYAHDHDDRYMPGASEIQMRNLHRWHGTRTAPSQAFTDHGAPIDGYLEGQAGKRIRACPEFLPIMEDLSRRGAGFERGCGGYGYNQAFVGSERYEVVKGIWEIRTDRRGSRRSRFRSPTLTVAFADSAIALDEVIEYSFLEPAAWPQWPEYRPDPSTHFRHGGKASVAWLDGHVTSETMSHTESSGVYPVAPGEVGIGWFGEVIDNRHYDYQ